jgi:hypothetical protein
MRFIRAFLAAIMLLFLAADEPDREMPPREALSRWQSYVGQWRGVGQPRRGSAKDAWTEDCGWAWSFGEQSVALVHTSTSGRYLRSARLTAAKERGLFELAVEQADGATRVFSGRPNEDGQLVLLAKDDTEGLPARITIRLVAGGDRMLVLYERKAGEDTYARLAEVGFTRQGSSFGKAATYVECIVTGGAGTIPVSYQGQTYYVCCTGCRDYFQDNAAKVLAEYKATKAAAKP